MKKKIILLGAVAAASLATVSLASCKNSDKENTTESGSTSQSTTKEEAKQTGISISGYTTTLLLDGDIKSTYKDAKVVANYSDGTTKDITDSVTFDTSKVNVSKEGSYPVYIVQGSYLTMYLVKVANYSLESIEVDTANFNTTLPLYSTFDFSDVVVKGNYKNPVDSTVSSSVIDHEYVTFTVTDSENKVVTQLESAGTYTVTVAYSGKTCTFDITCANPDQASSVKAAVEQALKSDASVNSGTYIYSNNYTEDGSDYQIKKNYTIGQGFVKQELENIYYGTSYGVTTSYFSVASNGSGFGVSVDEDGNVSKYYGDHSVNALDAYAVGFDFFEDGGTVYPQYGFAEVIKALYDKYESTYSTETQVTKHQSVSEDGKTYSFDFNDITNSSGSAHFTHYSVSFTVNAEGAIESANITCNVYEYDDAEDDYSYGGISYNNLKQEGYTLPQSFGLTLVKGEAVGGGEVYSFVIGDTAKVSTTNTYKVTQTSGVKQAASENPYSSDKVAIASFKVSKLNDEGTYEEMVEGATYTDDLDYATVSKDDGSHAFAFTVKVDEITPETANSDLDSVKVSIKGTAFDGTVVDTEDWYSSTYNYAYASNNGDGTYTLRFGRAGQYTVTVSSLLVTKTYTFDIKDEAPTSISPLLQDGEATSDFQTVDTFECYTTNSLYLSCDIAKYYTQGYTLSVLESVNGEFVETKNATVTKDYYTINGKSVQCYKFASTKAGEYKLVFTGATPDNPDKKAAEASIVVTVKDVPSVDDIVKGDHNYLFEATVSASEMYKVEFGAPTNNSGTITIWNKYDATKKQEGTYKYTDGKFVIDVESDTINLADSATFDIYVTSYYGLKLKNSVTGESYSLLAPTSDITDSELALLTGKYEATADSTTISLAITPSKTVKGDGSIAITISDGTTSSTGVYDYTFNCTTKALDLTPTGESSPFSGTIKVSNDKLVYVAQGSTSEVEFESKAININEICSGDYTVTDGNGVNYTIKFADDKVTIKNLSNSREKVCTYAYDESTSQLKLTKVSGASKTVGVENYLYIIDGKLSYKGFKMGSSGMEEYIAVCVKEGGSTEVVTIPTSAQGTWYGSTEDFDFTVVIDSNKAVVNDGEAEYTYTLKSVNGNVITLIDSSYTLTLTVSSSSIAYDDGTYTMTLSKTKTYKTPAGYDGKWTGTATDGTEYEVLLTEGSTSVTIVANEESTIAKIINISGNVITAAYGNSTDWDYTEYTITLNDGSIEFYDGYFTNTVTLTKADSTTTTIEFTEEFVGTWASSDGSYYALISTSSINLNDEDGELVSFEEDTYTFTVGDSKYVIFAAEDGTLTLRPYNNGIVDTSTNVTLSKVVVYDIYDNGASINKTVYVFGNKIIVNDGETPTEYTISSKSETEIIGVDSWNYQAKLTLVDGVVTKYSELADGSESWEDYDVVVHDSSSDDDGDVSFGADYVGTWVNSDSSSTIVITETGITVDNVDATDVSYSADDDVYYFNVDEQAYQMFVYNGTLTLSKVKDGMEQTSTRVDYTKQSDDLIAQSYTVNNYAGGCQIVVKSQETIEVVTTETHTCTVTGISDGVVFAADSDFMVKFTVVNGVIKTYQEMGDEDWSTAYDVVVFSSQE